MPHNRDVRVPGLRQNDQSQGRHGAGAQPVLGEKGTYEGVADPLENRYRIKTTIPRALDVVVAGLEPEARNTVDILKDTNHI